LLGQLSRGRRCRAARFDELDRITSVIRDFQFIASDRPGSGDQEY